MIDRLLVSPSDRILSFSFLSLWTEGDDSMLIRKISTLLCLGILLCSCSTETKDKEIDSDIVSTTAPSPTVEQRPEELHFKILSKQVNENDEWVIFLEPMNIDSDEQKKRILRVVKHLFHENRNINKMSIWIDETTALMYINGEDGKTDNLTGWEGLDYRLAVASREENEIHVYQALGRDDFIDISTGLQDL